MAEEVWSSRLDERYDIKVMRTSPYNGKLTIEENGSVVYEKDVGLSYNATFGPDVADVAAWQDIAIQFADGKAAGEPS